jgi:hypothetical protein
VKRIHPTVVNGEPGWLIVVPEWLYAKIAQSQGGMEGWGFEMGVLCVLVCAWWMWV